MYTSMWLMRFLMCPLNAIDQMFSDFGGTWKNTGKKSWCKSHYIVTTDVFLHLFQTNNYCCCFKYKTLTIPRHRGISQRKAVQTRVACSKCTSINELIAAERKGKKNHCCVINNRQQKHLYDKTDYYMPATFTPIIPQLSSLHCSCAFTHFISATPLIHSVSV